MHGPWVGDGLDVVWPLVDDDVRCGLAFGSYMHVDGQPCSHIFLYPCIQTNRAW